MFKKKYNYVKPQNLKLILKPICVKFMILSKKKKIQKSIEDKDKQDIEVQG